MHRHFKIEQKLYFLWPQMYVWMYRLKIAYIQKMYQKSVLFSVFCAQMLIAIAIQRDQILWVRVAIVFEVTLFLWRGWSTTKNIAYTEKNFCCQRCTFEIKPFFQKLIPTHLSPNYPFINRAHCGLQTIFGICNF